MGVRVFVCVCVWLWRASWHKVHHSKWVCPRFIFSFRMSKKSQYIGSLPYKQVLQLLDWGARQEAWLGHRHTHTCIHIQTHLHMFHSLLRWEEPDIPYQPSESQSQEQRWMEMGLQVSRCSHLQGAVWCCTDILLWLSAALLMYQRLLSYSIGVSWDVGGRERGWKLEMGVRSKGDKKEDPL